MKASQHFEVFGLMIRLGIESKSTISVADALSNTYIPQSLFVARLIRATLLINLLVATLLINLLVATLLINSLVATLLIKAFKSVLSFAT